MIHRYILLYNCLARCQGGTCELLKLRGTPKAYYYQAYMETCMWPRRKTVMDMVTT